MCLFCRIASGEAPSHMVYEDEFTVAFLDIHPVSDGHTLVIPRYHEPRIERLPADDYAALWETVYRLIDPIQRAMSVPATWVTVNNGAEAGPIVPHVHVHIIPRKGPGRSTLSAVVRRAKPRSSEYFMDIAEKIRKEMGG